MVEFRTSAGKRHGIRAKKCGPPGPNGHRRAAVPPRTRLI